MPRPRPPHLQRQVTQHGKTVWYVRIGKGPRTRIRAEFGTPEFGAEYKAEMGLCRTKERCARCWQSCLVDRALPRNR